MSPNVTKPAPKRRFRFSLRTLLVMPVVVAAVCWWVIWPERTARKFVEHLNAGDVEGARAMIDGQHPSDAFWRLAAEEGMTFGLPAVSSRRWTDYLSSRWHFTLTGRLSGFKGEGTVYIASSLMAQRGRLIAQEP